jgi:hypothetical protein
MGSSGFWLVVAMFALLAAWPLCAVGGAVFDAVLGWVYDGADGREGR